MKHDLIVLENLIRNAKLYNEPHMVKIFEKEKEEELKKIKVKKLGGNKK